MSERIVIKVGSSLVTNEGRGLDTTAMQGWCTQIAQLVHQGHQVVLVSSGAIAEGIQRLGWSQRPTQLHALQAAAAVGQMGLVQAYEAAFRACDVGSAQILLTHADLADRERYLNARSTLRTLLELGIVPVINENDTVVTDEIRFGDNDTLGALVANLIEADLFIILTDQAGLFSADPRQDPTAHLIAQAQAGDPALEQMAGGAGTAVGTGGMLTKVLAAKRAARSGADTVIASGREPNGLRRLLAGEAIGTRLQAPTGKLQAKKQWMADHLQVRGRVLIDAGAAQKLQTQGASLLPIGMLSVAGSFVRGDVIAIAIAISPASDQVIARGIANYSSQEAALICGLSSDRLSQVLGPDPDIEMVHRDNLVLV
jgi:glutamate 5-kinase